MSKQSSTGFGPVGDAPSPHGSRIAIVVGDVRPGAVHPFRRRRIAAVTAVVAVLAAGALAAGAVSGRGPALEPSAHAVPTSSPTSASSSSRSPSGTPAPTPTLPTFPSASPNAASPNPARPAPSGSPDPTAAPSFDRSAHSIDDPNSLWVVVDKTRPLHPADYAPTDLVDVPVPHVWAPKLRREASDAVVALFGAFTAETGLQLQSQSSYRSYSTQVDVYNQDVASNGQAVADTSTARPGTSEHQTGLTIDISALPGICSLEACFGDTPHGTWLAGNAWRFGFLLRYPADKVPVTGYGYEPWHFRYIGVELATEMHDRGVTTLEELFGLPAAPGYN
ncbi:D-alanyl-D-alanine carboxypeptidase family protein [Cryobacterium sp. TMT1-21]|uniref:D-alanyl-D-alanine carboxypeptidase family protein n=1 Tax=Cryobacterium shii TaxID=1259235 RepID=A0AAQ2C788_9MICO|nr:D-alanyl-D-alanine carboxypeptidase family protein [Cryobacterium shii]TFC89448.1 D-alanyl-D-alanine carboxypeptidase family protein [Cryobacterium sp. TmT2-59]TFD07167.1 D-alanyl-D-alanine carboxypeptidase family protein [Cryobacterium sp. TMT1-21]TFD15880.1 D-alanyl-D-alanine carboxypeptidase family protein [Cryobacterium sp. TMT2-23]TFD37479.1 D-alanyl-D-alanine carboxypeptidase family protein [Cryobacterium sp. TMT2-10]